MDLIQIGQPPPSGGESSGGAYIDPVCGMAVDPASAAGSFKYAGREFFFCSRHCLEKFKADPEAYLASTPTDLRRLTPAARRGAKYTCPMHPEVVQDGPGTCPKCGMALEPMTPTAEGGPDPELRGMQRRGFVAVGVTL